MVWKNANQCQIALGMQERFLERKNWRIQQKETKKPKKDIKKIIQIILGYGLEGLI